MKYIISIHYVSPITDFSNHRWIWRWRSRVLNDSHLNTPTYWIDSQTPENASHFAMRITLFHHWSAHHKFFSV